jgi:hypothetical protein
MLLDKSEEVRFMSHHYSSNATNEIGTCLKAMTGTVTPVQQQQLRRPLPEVPWPCFTSVPPFKADHSNMPMEL